MFYGVTDYFGFVVGAVAVILLPGPNSLFVLATSGQFGPARGLRAMAGVFLGDTTLMTLTALGAAGALRAHPDLFSLLKFMGACYLLWLGAGLIKSAILGWHKGPGPDVTRVKLIDSNTFMRALGLSLLNPKAILFFISFFVQFVDPGYESPWLSFLILGVTLQGISMAYLAALVFAGHRLVDAFRGHHKIGAVLMGLVGVLFAVFAVLLVTPGAM